MLNVSVERLIKFIKKDPNYSIKVDLSAEDLAVILIKRGRALLRGWLYLTTR